MKCFKPGMYLRFSDLRLSDMPLDHYIKWTESETANLRGHWRRVYAEFPKWTWTKRFKETMRRAVQPSRYRAAFKLPGYAFLDKPGPVTFLPPIQGDHAQNSPRYRDRPLPEAHTTRVLPTEVNPVFGGVDVAKSGSDVSVVSVCGQVTCKGVTLIIPLALSTVPVSQLFEEFVARLYQGVPVIKAPMVPQDDRPPVPNPPIFVPKAPPVFKPPVVKTPPKPIEPPKPPPIKSFCDLDVVRTTPKASPVVARAPIVLSAPSLPSASGKFIYGTLKKSDLIGRAQVLARYLQENRTTIGVHKVQELEDQLEELWSQRRQELAKGSS